MKNERQSRILEIIEREDIDTQEMLLDRLEKMGITCTQATISRDIKQLHLIKEPVGRGKYRYAVSIHRNSLNVADKLRTIFRESSTSIDYAQNIVVIKTMAGLASAAAAAIAIPATVLTTRIFWAISMDIKLSRRMPTYLSPM